MRNIYFMALALVFLFYQDIALSKCWKNSLGMKICNSESIIKDIKKETGNVINNTPIYGPGGVGPIWGGGACGSGITSKIVPDKFGNNTAHADFGPACREHDKCYDERHGKKYCDNKLRNHLYRRCQYGFPGVMAPWKVQCNAVIEGYYQAVRAAAMGYPSQNSNVTFSIKSKHKYIVSYKYFSQDNKRSYWGPYKLDDSQWHKTKLNCSKGEQICYGAWSGNNYWGVGEKGNASCDKCCGRCNEGNSKFSLK